MNSVVTMYADVNTEITAYNTAHSTTHSLLRIYRWRNTRIEVPAVYTWMPIQAPFEERDPSRWRDTITLVPRIAVAYTDGEESFPALEVYADCFRYVVDGKFDRHDPLGGVTQWARRVSMRFTSDTFNDIEYLVWEAPMEFRVDRNIHTP